MPTSMTPTRSSRATGNNRPHPPCLEFKGSSQLAGRRSGKGTVSDRAACPLRGPIALALITATVLPRGMAARTRPFSHREKYDLGRSTYPSKWTPETGITGVIMVIWRGKWPPASQTLRLKASRTALGHDTAFPITRTAERKGTHGDAAAPQWPGLVWHRPSHPCPGYYLLTGDYDIPPGAKSRFSVGFSWTRFHARGAYL
jgi:hypothetical protein